jgi:hypothetical protein
MSAKDSKFYEEAYKKLNYFKKQLETYRKQYERDGNIDPKEQAHLNAIQAQYDQVFKAISDRTAKADKEDAAADAAVKKKEAEAKNKQIGPGERLALQNMVKQAAKDLAQSARSSGDRFAIAVMHACEAFKVYTKSKLKELDGEIKAADFLGPMISIVTGGIGSALAKGADAVGAAVEKQILAVAKDTMNKKAKSIGNDSKDLEKAVDELVLGANDTAARLKEVIESVVVKRCDNVIIEVGKGNALNDALTKFITPFIGASEGEVDKLLEKRLGLPNAATAKKTHVEIYKRLVTKFEEKHIEATTSSYEKMEWAARGGGMPDRKRREAEERGRVAARTREAAIDKAPAPAPTR